MALTKISTDGVKDDAVTTDKLANAINTERTANTAKVSLGADSVTGAKIADDAVGAEHIEQLDADLSFADSAKAKFGAGNDLQIYHDGTTNIIEGLDGNMSLRPKTGENGILIRNNGSVDLYYDDVKQCETAADGLAFPSGKGINFNATADASGTGVTAGSELLDDYEEGTWTPGLTIGGATTGIVYSSQLGYYTKIGRLVHVSAYLQLSNAGSGTGVLYLTGLPFTTLDATGARASGSVGWYAGLGGSVDHPILLLVEQNDTSFPMRDSGSTGTNNMVHSDISNSFGIFFNLTYIA